MFYTPGLDSVLCVQTNKSKTKYQQRQSSLIDGCFRRQLITYLF